MKTYVINLDKDVERLRSTLGCLESINVRDIERISAVDGRKMSTQEIQNACTGFASRWMTKAMIGCALSHMTAWQKLIDDVDETRALIVEDDVYFDKQFDMMTVIATLPPANDADVMYLGYIRGTLDYFGYKEQYDDHWARFEYPYGLSSYIITTQGAKKLMTFIRQNGGLNQPIDEILAQAMRKNVVTSLIHRPPLLFQSSNTADHSRLDHSAINDHSYPTMINQLCRMLPRNSHSDISIPSMLGIVRFQITDSIPITQFDIAVVLVFSCTSTILPFDMFIAWLIVFLCLILYNVLDAPLKVLKTCIMLAIGIAFGSAFGSLFR